MGKVIASVQVSGDEALSKDSGSGAVEDFWVNESNDSHHLLRLCPTVGPLT